MTGSPSCVATTSRTWRSRARRGSISCWRARPGGRVRAGAKRLGYSAERLDELNRRAIELMRELRDREGELRDDLRDERLRRAPQGDGYQPRESCSAPRTPRAITRPRARQTSPPRRADMATAITMTYAEEAIGFTRAADSAASPGASPSRSRPTAAAERRIARGGDPAHTTRRTAGPRLLHDQLRPPDPLRGLLEDGGVALANPRPAGQRVDPSHAELDEADRLDDGDPADLGRALRRARPRGSRRSRGRWLLRHRPPPRVGDCRRLACVIDLSSPVARRGDHRRMEMGVADRELLGEVVIGRRFNGPAASANGGYACGSFARFVGRARRGDAADASRARPAVRGRFDGDDGVRCATATPGRRGDARRVARSWCRRCGQASSRRSRLGRAPRERGSSSALGLFRAAPSARRPPRQPRPDRRRGRHRRCSVPARTRSSPEEGSPSQRSSGQRSTAPATSPRCGTAAKWTRPRSACSAA